MGTNVALNIAMATLDCADPRKLSAFWAEALHTTVAGDYGEFIILAPPPGGQLSLGFQKVADGTCHRDVLGARSGL